MGSLTVANVVADSEGGSAAPNPIRRWRPAGKRRRQLTVTVSHNVFFDYEASEIYRVLDDDPVDDPAGLVRAEEVLFAAGWGIAGWGRIGRYQWQAPAFDLADPDLVVFLTRALLSGKLCLTRDTTRIGRYLARAGGEELLDTFTREITGQRPKMGAALAWAWQR